MKIFRTLLVDDNDAFLVLAKHLVAALPPIEVIGTARDGKEALRLADELKPDLILMDMSMPGMGGLQAAKLIRALGTPVRILIATHYDDAEHLALTLESGADGLISKRGYETGIAEFLQRSLPELILIAEVVLVPVRVEPKVL